MEAVIHVRLLGQPLQGLGWVLQQENKQLSSTYSAFCTSVFTSTCAVCLHVWLMYCAWGHVKNTHLHALCVCMNHAWGHMKGTHEHVLSACMDHVVHAVM